MKYLVVFAAIIIAFSTGCTKSPQQPTHAQIIINHTWYLKSLVISGIDDSAQCYLSEQLTFHKDSTGNHYYPILCDSTELNNMPFRWYIEDNTVINNATTPNYYTGVIGSTTLYTTHINGLPDSSTTLRLFVITDDSLGIEGEINSGHNYRAVYTSSK